MADWVSWKGHCIVITFMQFLGRKNVAFLNAFIHTYTHLALLWLMPVIFEICIGINFGCQQNIRYLQTCAIESTTVMDCYQKCNIESKWGTFENKTHLVMLFPAKHLLQQTFWHTQSKCHNKNT